MKLKKGIYFQNVGWQEKLVHDASFGQCGI